MQGDTCWLLVAGAVAIGSKRTWMFLGFSKQQSEIKPPVRNLEFRDVYVFGIHFAPLSSPRGTPCWHLRDINLRWPPVFVRLVLPLRDSLVVHHVDGDLQRREDNSHHHHAYLDQQSMMVANPMSVPPLMSQSRSEILTMAHPPPCSTASRPSTH